MNTQKINFFQQKLLDRQKAISETTTSSNGEVQVSFNGSIEITELIINANMSDEETKRILIETINQGIKQTTLKINEVVKTLSMEIQNQTLT